METQPKLLPCPFCRCAEVTIEWEPCEPMVEGDTNRRWFAECPSCSCQGPFCQRENEVIANWNARATPPLSAPVAAFALKIEAQSKQDGFGEGDDLEYETISDMIDDARFALSKSDTPEELLSRSVSLAVMCLFMADAAGGLETEEGK